MAVRPVVVMCPDSLGSALLAMAVPTGGRTDDVLGRIPVLGRRGELPDARRRVMLAADAVAEAVPLSRIPLVDAEAVAEQIVEHFTADTYPAVVLGSPHGAAVHFAAACGAAWLPTSFTLTAPWPGGSAGNWVAAMEWGSRLAERLLANNPGISVRQVHDPAARGPLCGATVSLQVRWRTLPSAYRKFLCSRLTPGGSSVLVRDLRTWPVLEGAGGYSFQTGTPAAGRHPDAYSMADSSFRRLLHRIGEHDWATADADTALQYTHTSGEPRLEVELREVAARTGRSAHRVLFTDAQALSACVADLYRTWLRPVNGGRRCFVGTGRMTDPWRAISRGYVPYWCESSTRAVTGAAQLWLAGSEPFDEVHVLPEPPGTLHDDTATLTHWRGVALFARRAGRVDIAASDRYPLLPPAPRHASSFLASSARPQPPPGPLPAGEAVRRLTQHGTTLGLLVV